MCHGCQFFVIVLGHITNLNYSVWCEQTVAYHYIHCRLVRSFRGQISCCYWSISLSSSSLSSHSVSLSGKAALAKGTPFAIKLMYISIIMQCVVQQWSSWTGRGIHILLLDLCSILFCPSAWLWEAGIVSCLLLVNVFWCRPNYIAHGTNWIHHLSRPLTYAFRIPSRFKKLPLVGGHYSDFRLVQRPW